jgi:hypothetical protein
VSTEPNYRRKLKIVLPWLSQIDATLCRWTGSFVVVSGTSFMVCHAFT